jgi:peptide deformylase
MAIREVLRIGNPVLLDRAKPVESFNTAELHELITDMRDTMAALNGAGLAAPQIGISLRVVIFALEHNPRYPDVAPIPETVLINPLVDIIDEATDDAWEGCLSVPGMRGKVPRYRAIRYRGFTVDGQQIDRTVDGFHARVVQHECDHLDGILYPQRIVDLRDFGFEEELGKE